MKKLITMLSALTLTSSIALLATVYTENKINEGEIKTDDDLEKNDINLLEILNCKIKKFYLLIFSINVFSLPKMK